MINGLVKIGKAIYKHRAGIAVTVGVVTGVACVVETARKSVKNTPWILDEHEEKMEDLKEFDIDSYLYGLCVEK